MKHSALTNSASANFPNTFRSTPGSILVIWGFISIVQFVAGISDNQIAKYGSLVGVLMAILLSNAPFAAFCVVFSRYLARAKYSRIDLIKIIQMLGFFSLFWFVPLVVYEAAINPIVLGPGKIETLPTHVAAYPALYWTFDYLIFSGCFAATLAAHIWQAHHLSEQRRNIAEHDNLTLRLALEQQRMRALQDQLEPHFLFNSLNAIGALVREGEKSNALTAINTLSNLLRYAIQVSHGPWSELRSELDFVADYLYLQRTRFGERLKFDLPTVPEDVEHQKVPALIIQPLVENALRHELERHGLETYIRIELHVLDESLLIRISNPIKNVGLENPGTGMGQLNIRERLNISYGPVAKLLTEVRADEYVATLELPRSTHD